MNYQYAQQCLQDYRYYRFSFPDEAHPRYEHYYDWIKEHESELETLRDTKEDAKDNPRLERRAKELLLGFQAFYLLFRSADLDTWPLERSFEPWSETLRDFMNEEELLTLSDYSDEQHHSDVWDVATTLFKTEIETKYKEVGSTIPDEHSYPEPPTDDLIVSIPYTHGRNVYFEASFAEDMVQSWSSGSLTATSHAIEVSHILLTRLGRPFKIDQSTINFVEKHSVKGGYRASFKDEETPTLYALRSAIVIHKAKLELKCEDNMGYEIAVEHFGKSRVEELLSHTISQLDEILQADSVRRATLIDLHHALYAIWNLGSINNSIPERITDSIDKIGEYLRHCYLPKSDWSNVPTFTLAPYSDVYCLTACMFVDHIIRRCEIEDRDLLEMMADTKAFVSKCFDESGGFACVPKQEPDLVHTFFGVALNKRNEWHFESDAGIKNYEDGIEVFLNSCRKNGYALVRDWKPSAYGARLAIQIYDYLELPLPEVRNTLRFIESLRMGDSGGYAGYIKPFA